MQCLFHRRVRFPILLLAVLAPATPLLLRAQAPPAAELRAVAARPDVWPREVVTRVAVPVTDKKAPPIPAGTTMKVVGLEGALIGVDYRGTLFMVPVAQTDFIEQAAAILAQMPSPTPRATTASPAPIPVVAPGFMEVAQPGVSNELGMQLERALVTLDHSTGVDRLTASNARLSTKRYLLLQLGGGRGFAEASAELRGAIEKASARNDNFAFVLVPSPDKGAQGAIQLIHERGFNGLLVNPRETALVSQLWTKYGHAGSFALALVDARGQIVSQTVPMKRGVDKFHAVLNSLAQATNPAGAR